MSILRIFLLNSPVAHLQIGQNDLIQFGFQDQSFQDINYTLVFIHRPYYEYIFILFVSLLIYCVSLTQI